MNDISYEILDLFKKYGADKEGILKILEADSRPEVLYALSDIRRNLMDWMDFSGQHRKGSLNQGHFHMQRSACRFLKDMRITL